MDKADPVRESGEGELSPAQISRTMSPSVIPQMGNIYTFQSLTFDAIYFAVAVT